MQSVHVNTKAAGWPLRILAWEVTRNCNLDCVHCRASASRGPHQGELSTDECFRFLDELASFAKPVVILTGGEPLLRADILQLARRGTKLGMRTVLATNGTLLTKETASALKEAGIRRISISIDAASRERHDKFRGVSGAFDGAIAGIEAARAVGLPFQINSTITKTNVSELPGIFELARDLGADALHIFLLVPTGRGRELAEQELTAGQYEDTLIWFYEQHKNAGGMNLKATCAPHYYRIIRQRAAAEGEKVEEKSHGLDALTRGCLAGVAFCFVSHIGKVQPCGYLELECGDIRKTPLKEIWESSKIFADLRDFDAYKGKCGVCEYRRVCGGCRARAYEVTGDYMGAEPYCSYIPRGAGAVKI